MGVAELKCIGPPGWREVASTGIFSGACGLCSFLPRPTDSCRVHFQEMAKHRPASGFAGKQLLLFTFPFPTFVGWRALGARRWREFGCELREPLG